MFSPLGRYEEVFTALHTLCQAWGGVGQRGEGLPSSGSPLEAQSDYWFPPAGPVAPQHCRYFGLLQPDVRKKESLACFPDQAVLLPTTCGVESRPMGEIRIGTSAFTAAGWEGSFYPTGMKPGDYLSYYATKFDTVQLDNTFYRTPSLSTVQRWNAKTPPGFIFAAKVPQVITHEKVLVDCDEDLKHFLTTMDALGDKLGPLLFQFGYFNKSKFKSQAEFLLCLEPFLKKLPKGYKFAVEIRNKDWLDLRYAHLVRGYGVAQALIDQEWVMRPWEVKNRFNLVTADWTYVRWLGDRKGIEEVTKTWDKTIVDRRVDLKDWVEIFKEFVIRNIKIFAFANNHYAGHAPNTVKLFWELWDKKR